jgi:DNA-binding NarL/FixJ family response regulator
MRELHTRGPLARSPVFKTYWGEPMDRYTALKQVDFTVRMSLLSDIPVIVVTVCDRQDSEERALHLGAAAYVSKPVHADALRATIQTVLATRDGVPAGGTR